MWCGAVLKVTFQHTAARRRLKTFNIFMIMQCLFQHTAARRRLIATCASTPRSVTFQHTAARRRLMLAGSRLGSEGVVSTHSRAKAADY